MRAAAERVVKSIAGMKGAMVALTADKKAGSGGRTGFPAASPAPQAHDHHGHDHNHGHNHGHSHAQPAAPAGRQPTANAKAGIPGVAAIIAVASGKGGVGKSTTAVNLALGLQAIGLKVGVLDADIYGPSMPRLLGITGRPKQIEGRIIAPMENYGLKVMSMGFLVDEGVAMIWRGPMVMSALTRCCAKWPGASSTCWWSTCRGHGRLPADHGPAGAAGRRRHRLHAAGPGADRRPQGHQHVQQDRDPGARHRREHELFRLPLLRYLA